MHLKRQTDRPRKRQTDRSTERETDRRGCKYV